MNERLRRKAYRAFDDLPEEFSPGTIRQALEALDTMTWLLITALPQNHPTRREFNQAMRGQRKRLDAVNWTQFDESTDERRCDYQVLRIRLGMLKAIAEGQRSHNP